MYIFAFLAATTICIVYSILQASFIASHVCALGAGVCLGLWVSSYDRVAAIIYLFSKWWSSTNSAKRGIETLYDDNIILNLSLPSTAWFNMGYWVEKHYTFVEACEAMASHVATVTGLSHNDVLLDIGCGSGEQDFYFAKTFKCKRILAIDISPQQIALANGKLPHIKNGSSIMFMVGSATNLAGATTDGSKFLEADGGTAHFDKVLSLDSAYHYKLRVDFFSQAYKVLKPGGILGMADICLSDSVNLHKLHPYKRYILKAMLGAGHVPYENMYPRKEYQIKLEQAGFEDVQIEVITDFVFPGLIQYLELQKTRMDGITRSHHWLKLDGFVYMLRKCVQNKWIEFVVVSARKSGKM